ncbi:histidine phosphatase family protein [Bacillus sp. FJAT-45037]|uniref:histidine phosphatase family protein n=1 Tax=Bacillus sp. FJAT-45037 TaxID=2011007 RepID=UPI000C23E052|nr:histidine phosphatase family protein [Bacillus sp. FJAT-45037]
MNLYLIRHGESEGNRLGKIQGWKDFPLSNVGKQQAGQLGQFFKQIHLDYIYSSDLKRAHDTALTLGTASGQSVHTWEKIREVNLGPLEGLSRKEIYEQFPEVQHKTILTSEVEGTETISELTTRCQYVLDQMHRAHKKDDVALVSHGGFISILLMYMMIGESWATVHRPFLIGNTSITHIEWTESKKPLIHYVNRTAHLEETPDATQKLGIL